jgi:hypothetical protein
MPRSRSGSATWSLLLLLVLPFLSSATGASSAALPPSSSVPSLLQTEETRVYFAPTGQYLDGPFLSYWQSHGGLPIFGYPLTPAFRENGYLVQYFERSRFELHPENAGSPYEVLLGQLGKECLKSEALPVPKPDHAPPATGETLFPETGYKVGGVFLSYWQSHGGLAQFGYPLSPPLQQATANGTLSVQYFERARFELHPENAGTEYEVLLTLLGVEHANKLDPLLRAPWTTNASTSHLHLATQNKHLSALDPVSITSDVAGEVRVLGGDNRVYATYPVSPGIPLTLTAAGMWGEQSVVLLVNGSPLDAIWGAYVMAEPAWGVQSGDPTWDDLYAKVSNFLKQDQVDYLAPDNVTPVHGYRSPDNIAIWLRDYVYQQKGFKYFEPDMTTTLDYFRSTQRADGSLDDYLYHTGATLVYTDQIEIEADREYLFVEGIWTAWETTGDDAWLWSNLGTMERSLSSLWDDPRRWSPEYGLIKRAFTIDTWDFEQGSTEKVVRRNIDGNTEWSIMHGDNTGAYHAALTLASIERYLGRVSVAQLWEARAASLRENLNNLAWNGHFYTHQIHLTPIAPTGVDESQQLSLSNAYALNRGTLSHQQAVSLLQTYQARRAQNQPTIFAEWYSIDPAFRYGFSTPGEYVNGGIMPLVGGELARGAFDNGFETYGVDILRRYYAMILRDGGSYLWYHTDGTPGITSDATLSTDGWGSSEMLGAMTEGLAGVVDNGKLFESVNLSPRWATTDRANVAVALQYPASGAYLAYRLSLNPDNTISLAWGGRYTLSVHLHLMLPHGFTPSLLTANGSPIPFTISTLEGSSYLDAVLDKAEPVLIR